MATGTVKWFSDEKGFGFITPDDQGKDLFVHHSGIAGGGFRSLTEGDKVTYVMEGLRSLILEDLEWSAIMPAFAVVGVTGALMLVLNVRLINRYD